jgi:hypothetical protein
LFLQVVEHGVKLVAGFRLSRQLTGPIFQGSVMIIIYNNQTNQRKHSYAVCIQSCNVYINWTASACCSCIVAIFKHITPTSSSASQSNTTTETVGLQYFTHSACDKYTVWYSLNSCPDCLLLNHMAYIVEMMMVMIYLTLFLLHQWYSTFCVHVTTEIFSQLCTSKVVGA